MGAGVRDAFPPPMCVWIVVFIHLRMETPLRGRSGGHTGTAPTVSFGQIARGTVGVVWVDCVWTVGFVWVDCVCGFVCWLVKTVHMNQHHRCCTFDSPGLPPIVGYPGESRGGEPMPSALYFLICALTFCKIYSVVSSPCKMSLSTTLRTKANISIFTHRTPHFISLFS